MISELALAAGVSAIDAAVIVGRARAKLEACLAVDVADRTLRRLVISALRSTQPIDTLTNDVRFVVARACDQETKQLFLDPRSAEGDRKRKSKRHRNHVRSFKVKP